MVDWVECGSCTSVGKEEVSASSASATNNKKKKKHTLHSEHLPPAMSHRPRQPRGWFVQENIVEDDLFGAMIDWKKGASSY